VGNTVSSLPWWLKLTLKVGLARLPFSYKFWQRMRLFRHGDMDDAFYAKDVLDFHIQHAQLKGMLKGRMVLELGCGDSIATAIIAASYGAKSVLVDTGCFATTDISSYLEIVRELKKKGIQPPDISGCSNINDILDVCGAQYLTRGLDSLRTIPSGTVDFIFSQAVLEHIRKNEFLETMEECARILSDTGIASHRVDLKDHLGGSLNSLRFSKRLWEANWMANSGFYTNRVRFQEMLSIFESSGFSIEVTKTRSWKNLPIDKTKMSREFASLSVKNLSIKEFDVLLRKNALFRANH